MVKTKEEIVKDSLSHKYYVHGKCIKCNNEFEKMTNSRGVYSCCCSDKCAKEIIAERKRRNKERHHYEVFRDNKFYYIKDDGVFVEKRTYMGKTWTLKSNSKLTIPQNAIKIIDKISAYLYDKEHPFNKWRKLTGLTVS